MDNLLKVYIVKKKTELRKRNTGYLFGWSTMYQMICSTRIRRVAHAFFCLATTNFVCPSFFRNVFKVPNSSQYD